MRETLSSTILAGDRLVVRAGISPIKVRTCTATRNAAALWQQRPAESAVNLQQLLLHGLFFVDLRGGGSRHLERSLLPVLNPISTSLPRLVGCNQFRNMVNNGYTARTTNA